MGESNAVPEPLWFQGCLLQDGTPGAVMMLGERKVDFVSTSRMRETAVSLLQLAECMEAESFFQAWLKWKQPALTDEALTNALADWRRLREERTGKKTGPVSPEEWIGG